MRTLLPSATCAGLLALAGTLATTPLRGADAPKPADAPKVDAPKIARVVDVFREDTRVLPGHPKPKRAGLNDVIVVQIENLDLAPASFNLAQCVPYLNGLALKGCTPLSID